MARAKKPGKKGRNRRNLSKNLKRIENNVKVLNSLKEESK